MATCSRFPLVMLVGLVLTVASGSHTAHAQGNAAEKAEQLNNEGKSLFGAKDYPAAAQKFREAILFSPEGRFYFNLCYCLNKMGQYREAITACENVEKYKASNPLIEKANQLLTALREHVKNTSQDPNLNPDGTGDGGTGDGGTGDGGTGDGGTGDGGTGDGGTGGTGDGGTGAAGGPPPPPPGGVVEAPAAPPLGEYKWSLGFELGGVLSSLGDSDLYARNGGQFRFHADFPLPGKSNFGLSGYIQATNMVAMDDMFVDGMQVVDIGGALYQHRRINDRLWWTWLGGAQIAIISPTSIGEDGLATIGARGEGSVQYLLGSRGQHVLQAAVGLNLYLPSSEGTASIDPADYGLDKMGMTFGVNFGYIFRFDQPFGSAPVFTLE